MTWGLDQRGLRDRYSSRKARGALDSFFHRSAKLSARRPSSLDPRAAPFDAAAGLRFFEQVHVAYCAAVALGAAGAAAAGGGGPAASAMRGVRIEAAEGSDGPGWDSDAEDEEDLLVEAQGEGEDGPDGGG